MASNRSKSPATGYVRLGNKRAGAPGKPKPGEAEVGVDRRNRVLAIPSCSTTPKRATVNERFRTRYQADLEGDGPMAAATEAIAQGVRNGERIVCMCRCWPKPCHGNVIVDEIRRRLE
jgi:hypothetical protein